MKRLGRDQEVKDFMDYYKTKILGHQVLDWICYLLYFYNYFIPWLIEQWMEYAGDSKIVVKDKKFGARDTKNANYLINILIDEWSQIQEQFESK